MEIDVKKFELLLKQKHHKDVIEILTSILDTLKEGDSNSDIITLIEVIKGYTTEIPSAILSIAQVITTKLEELKNKPKESWEFRVISRDMYGNIDTVKAKQL